MKNLTIVTLITMVVSLSITPLTNSTHAQATGEKAKIEMQPDDYLNRAMNNIKPRHDGKVTGEMFCWHAAAGAEQYTTAYHATGDIAWLSAAQKYFDHLLSLMAEAPDGYKGWIGAYGYDTQYMCDVHVGDAILINPMLDFAEVVLADEQLTNQFGDAAAQYIATAKKHFVEKWDTRGTWIEDGEYGVYVSWTKYLLPDDWTQWRTIESAAGSGLSLPFNKQITSTLVSLRLYRITGEEKYWDIARRANLLMKRRFQFLGQHYSWNYWEPLGPWDVTPDGRGMRHWVNTHPYRNYQTGEVADIVEAYHNGLVFDENDIKRIISTNLDVMWNGSLDKPRFRNSNTLGPWRGVDKPVPAGKRGWAGSLWPLGDFSQTVRRLQTRRLRKGSISHVFYHNITAQTPVSFERQLLDGRQPDVGETEYTQCIDLTMAAVLPAKITVGDQGYIVSKARRPGELDIELWSADRTEKLATLFTGRTEGGHDGHAGFVIVPWNGKIDNQPLAGQYIVRWISEGGVREYAIEVH